MTPEKNKAWQNAISLLDYLDFQAVSREGLNAVTQRLVERGVPEWAGDLRAAMVFCRQSGGIQPWHSDFALRSEVALVGISILYPTPELSEQVYQRLFVRFVAEALRPFVTWAQQSPGLRLQGNYSYEPLIVLYEACARFIPPADAKEWRTLESAQLDYRGMPEGTHEAFHAYLLSKELISEIRGVLGIKELGLSEDGEAVIGTLTLVVALNRQHQWRLEGAIGTREDEGNNHAELIANAYLTALEAECPPPSWLSQETLC